MPQDYTADIESIREWLAKENYLPQNFNDLMLRKFVHSCYGSLERTKKCIERFTTTRSTMSEVYTMRDPLSPRMQTAFSVTKVTTYKAGENEILIHRYDEPNGEQFCFYDELKSFAIQADHWLSTHEQLPEGHIIILDIKYYTLMMVAKSNIMYFRDFLLYLLEGMPVRVKEVHVLNCPSFYDKLYALVKPVLPAEIKEIIKFHSNPESLHKSIDKKYLPEEYGGDGVSMAEQNAKWVKEINEQREIFKNDNLWKADLKKRPKTNAVESTMNGSFRTLSID